ncbi:MAG: TrkA family potassium uptake protein [Candidatus Nanosalina sp.]
MYVVITGINSLSKRLVSRLEGKHDVVVIEENEDKCDRMYSSSGATVINKEPSTISALEDAGITRADIVIAARRQDNDNMVVCSLAKKYGVPKVVTRVEEDDYTEAFQIIGADPVNHNDILVSEFLSAVEHPYLVKLANVRGDREIVKGAVSDEDSSMTGKEVEEVYQMKDFPSSFQVSAVIREDDTVVDEEGVELGEDDELILIGPEKDKEQLDSFFQNQ